MAKPGSPEIERRALSLFERLADQPDHTRLRNRLLKNEPPDVLLRLADLEASVTAAKGALPTLIPGSADCEGLIPPPEFIGAFRLTERVGSGGMGDVWAAERADGLYEQKVAIKLIQRHALVRAATAFDDERRLLAKLEHPNIARLIDGGVTEDGLPWLATEFVDGKPIDDVAANLPLSDRIGLFIKAVDAVQYAHSHMVAHADLKPGNIIVTASGRVKLLDFGIAGLIDGERPGPVGSGPLTRAFASPQRRAGAVPSVADDVYALGKTLNLLLEAQSNAELRAIADMACAHEEADRYSSAAALIADLERWRARLPVRAVPDGWSYRAAKFLERHRLGVGLTGLAFAALTAISLVATTNFYRAERERKEAAARFEDARGSARYVALDLLDQLEQQPGTLALRTEAAKVAQATLDRLAASASSNDQVKLEAAEGLLRLAAAQGRPGRPNLRDIDAARANLNRAAVLTRNLEGDRARNLAVRIKIDQARLASWVDTDIPAALGFLDQAKRLMSQGPIDNVVLGSYFLELSATRQWAGDYTSATAAARRALDILPDQKELEAVLRRVTAYDLLAEATYYGGDQKGAIAPYRRAHALAQSLVIAEPGHRVAALQLVRSQWALATTLLGNGGDAEGLRLLNMAHASAIALVKLEPADGEARRMQSIVANARAQAMVANGRADQGLKLIAKDVAERKALWRALPSEPIRLRDYMVALKAQADMEVSTGRGQAGCDRYAEVRLLIAEMGTRKQLTGLDQSDVVTDLDRRQKASCANG